MHATPFYKCMDPGGFLVNLGSTILLQECTLHLLKACPDKVSPPCGSTKYKHLFMNTKWYLYKEIVLLSTNVRR